MLFSDAAYEMDTDTPAFQVFDSAFNRLYLSAVDLIGGFCY